MKNNGEGRIPVYHFQPEEQYRQVVEELPMAVYVCNNEGDIALYNNAAIQIWQREPVPGSDKWSGAFRLFNTNGELISPSNTAIATAIKEHRLFTEEIIIERPDGSRRHIRSQPQLLYTSGGAVSGVVNTMLDITEQKSTEQALLESELRLRLAIEGTQLATWDLDLHTHAIIHSPRLIEIFGHLPGATLTYAEMRNQVVAKDLNEIVEKAFDEAKLSGVYSYEARIKWPDGTIHWIRTQGKILYNDKKIPSRMLGTMIDITAQKNSMMELQESEERFKLVANAAPVKIWIADTNKLCSFFNKRWLDFTGRKMEEEVGNGWLDLVHLDDLPRCLDIFHSSFDARKEFYMEIRLKRHDGKYRWIDNNGVPRFTTDGKFEGFIGACRDITEIKEHEQRKDDFIRMASHELKTPVTSIKGYVQLLLRSPFTANNYMLNNSLTTINKQVSKLTKLIGDLLDLTKIEAGVLMLNKEVFEMKGLAEEIAEEVQTTSPSHTIIIEKSTEHSVVADRDRISQVLINFLTNAIKYSPASGKVIIRIDSNLNELIISVKDFGIGIDKKDHGRIFERFYRVQGKDEQTFPGFGIGLFIVNEIIASHGGSVWVESEKGKGSTFYFSLPIYMNQ